jgi:hypothetical protein
MNNARIELDRTDEAGPGSPPSVAELLRIDACHTPLAGKSPDPVVIVYGTGAGERQCTVVTERRGDLAGLRVVRGREAECRQHHAREFAQARSAAADT